MLNKKIHICVIDDGICENEISISRNIQIKDGKIIDAPGIWKNNSHGTGCAKVIAKNAKKNILISSVSILDKQYKGNTRSLCIALEWCTKNDVDIVNLSLGSVFFKDKELLLGAVNHCAENGIIIVAAISNAGYVTYPASFTNVIGVKSFEEKERKGYVVRYDTNLGFGLVETQGDEKIYIDGMKKTTSWCNSVAAPHITARIINMYSKDITPVSIRNSLGNKAIKINCFKIDWVTKAYIVNLIDLIPELCVFHIIKEEADRQFADTVIIENAEEICEFVENGKNVIYIGNDVIDNISNHNYIWSKFNRIQQINLNQQINVETSEVPVIFIKGLNTLIYLYGLGMFLQDRDHNVYSISHNILYELYGITYIPAEIIGSNRIGKFIRNELYYMQSDILLYDISEIDQEIAEQELGISPDIIIEANETYTTISSELGKRTIKNSIESVGEYVMELLTKE